MPNTPFNRYRYEGPAFDHFGNYISDFDLTTIAKSEAKALSNISYRIKRILNLQPTADIRLDSSCIRFLNQASFTRHPELNQYQAVLASVKQMDKLDKKEPEFHQMTLFEMENFNV